MIKFYYWMDESFQDYSWIKDSEADRKSASKSWIKQILIASLIYFQFDHLNLKLFKILN